MTYSIVARDADTGELGVAVQSHWFAVGPIVAWARPGVGAIATQANIEVSYGPRALEQLEMDVPPDVLSRLLSDDDPGAAGRQVAIVDAAGRVAAHTGASCIPHAGHVISDGVSCQGNMMAGGVCGRRCSRRSRPPTTRCCSSGYPPTWLRRRRPCWRGCEPTGEARMSRAIAAAAPTSLPPAPSDKSATPGEASSSEA